MKYIPLVMVRDHMDGIPAFACPPGCTIRTFVRGDEQRWARIEWLAGEFPDQEQALRQFTSEYGPYLSLLEDRGFFLEDSHGEAIGTATAWHNDFEGEERGRVSWVGIVPAYQGHGLAKPLLSAVMARLARDYRKAYLTTQTTSYRAINLYLNFGFEPYPVRPSCAEGWALMEEVLRRTIL
jgi:ribosomal protein S18 acetylase RimI-like enzyme